jgi:hypothetical protein
MAVLNFLKDHPFAVEAFFERSVVFTFAAPKASLEHLLPECLTLDTFNDKYGFVAVAMVETKNLRPKGMPKFSGNDFMLIGYRIFVRFEKNNGKRLRGLYILKSETNRKKMEFFGNIFTHYNYSTTDIRFEDEEDKTTVISEASNFRAAFRPSSEDAPLPEGSPFSSWKEARRFAGPLPFTFTYNSEEKEVLIIEGVRQNWKPQPLSVTNHHFEYIQNLNIDGMILANAFQITKVPYYWKKGLKEVWKG